MKSQICRHRRLCIRACAVALGCGLVSWPLQAQESSLLGLVARYGWAPAAESEPVSGLGLELELRPSNAFVASVRLEHWGVAIDCIGIGPCPSGFTAVALGGKYRLRGASAVTPYVGGDAGYVDWATDDDGFGLRFRAGADVHIVRHIDLNFDAGVTRFFDRPDITFPDTQLFGFTAGLRLWM